MNGDQCCTDTDPALRTVNADQCCTDADPALRTVNGPRPVRAVRRPSTKDREWRPVRYADPALRTVNGDQCGTRTQHLQERPRSFQPRATQASHNARDYMAVYFCRKELSGIKRSKLAAVKCHFGRVRLLETATTGAYPSMSRRVHVLLLT